MPSKIQTLAIVAAVAYGTASTMALPVPGSLQNGIEARSYGDEPLRLVARQDELAPVLVARGFDFVVWWHDLWNPPAHNATASAPANNGTASAHNGTTSASANNGTTSAHNGTASALPNNGTASAHNGTAPAHGPTPVMMGGAQANSTDTTKTASKGAGNAPQNLKARDLPDTTPDSDGGANTDSLASGTGATESVPDDRSSGRRRRFQIPDGPSGYDSYGSMAAKRMERIRRDSTRRHYLARHQLPDPTTDASVPPVDASVTHVDTSITQVDTSVTQVDASVSPDASVPPVDASVTPVDASYGVSLSSW